MEGITGALETADNMAVAGALFAYIIPYKGGAKWLKI